MWLLVPVVALLAFALGWFVRQRLSLRYKRLWRQAEALLEDRSLFEDPADRDQPADMVRKRGELAARIEALPRNQGSQREIGESATFTPYERGRWALDETYDGTTAVFTAIRSGFEPRVLGRTPNYQRFGALYRRDRENAENAVSELNRR
jgi:hypothetical protein